MKTINRNWYLRQLIERKNNGLIKIITGIRRCGKSFLLDPLFKDYLKQKGVSEDHIIKIELDKIENSKYHENPELLNIDINKLIVDNNHYYLILDEIQLVDKFELLLTGLIYNKKLDIYVTGSNSKFLSKDIITEFRGRGDQVHIYPFTFAEYMQSKNEAPQLCLDDYLTYGGMPLILSYSNDNAKSKYLKDLFNNSYYADIVDRNIVTRIDVLDTLTKSLASSIGSLSNPKKIYDTYKSHGERELSLNTVINYLRYLEDSFIVSKASRYNIKGKKYIGSPFKYYFTDLGLRNASLNFRQNEKSHLMENAIYNELLVRGYNVDIGIVESRTSKNRTTREVDFVCNMASERIYIQSALNIDTKEKSLQETASLDAINDSFRKIIIVGDNSKQWFTENGIKIMNVTDFLLNPESIN